MLKPSEAFEFLRLQRKAQDKRLVLMADENLFYLFEIDTMEIGAEVLSSSNYGVIERFVMQYRFVNHVMRQK